MYLKHYLFKYDIKLMKGKTLTKHSMHEKTAASVSLKLSNSGNEWCHNTDAPSSWAELHFQTHILSYHQGCIICINYPSNKLSFIRRVLNQSRTRNSLGQRLVVVSCVIFRGFYSLFCPIRLMFEKFFKHVEDKYHVCH